MYGYLWFLTLFSSTGTLLNNEYVVGNAIGKGGFGTVYEAISTSHPELKVCKVCQYEYNTIIVLFEFTNNLVDNLLEQNVKLRKCLINKVKPVSP